MGMSATLFGIALTVSVVFFLLAIHFSPDD
jgi:hypothetical protein